MEINDTGKNLYIYINCQETNLQSPCWQAFSLWYSLTKNLPDAEVSVYLGKDGSSHSGWAKKCNVPVVREIPAPGQKPVLILPENWLAIDSFDENWMNLMNGGCGGPIGEARFIPFEVNGLFDTYEHLFVSDVRADESTTFVRYSDFGNFVLSEWIDKYEGPLPYVRSLKTDNINALRVIDLWTRASNLFMVVT